MREIKRQFKKAIRTIVKFCTDSPYEYESNDIKDFKVARIFEETVLYYETLIITNPKDMALKLAKNDLQHLLNDNQKINELYDVIKKDRKKAGVN